MKWLIALRRVHTAAPLKLDRVLGAVRVFADTPPCSHGGSIEARRYRRRQWLQSNTPPCSHGGSIEACSQPPTVTVRGHSAVFTRRLH